MENGFKRATTEDLKGLSALYEELHRYHVGIDPERHTLPDKDFFTDTMEEFLDDGDREVILHETDGKPDAYALLIIDEFDNPDEQPRRVCFIEHFTVTESARRQGIGTALFNEIRGYAQTEGCDFIRLGVNSKNLSAIEFYEKMGFAPQSIRMEIKL